MRRAAEIALAGNLVLAALKLAAGFVTGSLAVIGDGVDSSADVLIAIMSLAVGHYVRRPSDKEHPWGHQRAETLATLALAFIIMLAGFQLFQSSLQQLRSGERSTLPGSAALVVTVFSIAAKLALALNQYRLGRRAGSAMVLANARNMRNDVVVSASVFVGIGASTVFDQPLLDPLTALLVGAWIMWSAVGIFREQNEELMDGHAGDEIYKALFAAVHSVPGAGNPHRARIRKMAATWDIVLDVEVNGGISVREAHEVAVRVEAAIRERIPEVYDVVVHVEPAGNVEHAERYGVSARDVE